MHVRDDNKYPYSTAPALPWAGSTRSATLIFCSWKEIALRVSHRRRKADYPRHAPRHRERCESRSVWTNNQCLRSSVRRRAIHGMCRCTRSVLRQALWRMKIFLLPHTGTPSTWAIDTPNEVHLWLERNGTCNVLGYVWDDVNYLHNSRSLPHGPNGFPCLCLMRLILTYTTIQCATTLITERAPRLWTSRLYLKWTPYTRINAKVATLFSGCDHRCPPRQDSRADIIVYSARMELSKRNQAYEDEA